MKLTTQSVLSHIAAMAEGAADGGALDDRIRAAGKAQRAERIVDLQQRREGHQRANTLIELIALAGDCISS